MLPIGPRLKTPLKHGPNSTRAIILTCTDADGGVGQRISGVGRHNLLPLSPVRRSVVQLICINLILAGVGCDRSENVSLSSRPDSQLLPEGAQSTLSDSQVAEPAEHQGSGALDRGVRTTPLGVPSSDKASTPSTRDRSQTELTIGSLEGAGPDVFGVIDDIAVDDARRIYALDTRLLVVRVFSPDGDFLWEVGRPGRGPGEFSLPSGLALHGDALMVLDAVNARLSVFQVADSVTRRGDLNLGFPGWDLCVMGDTAFVLGGSPNAVVYTFRVGRALPVAVGHFPVETLYDPLMAATLRPSIIACLDDRRTVAIAVPQLPTITLYQSDGHKVSRYDLEDFVQVRIERGDNGAVALTWPNAERWHHVITSVFTVSDSEVGVQIGVTQFGARDTHDISDLETRVINLESRETRRMATTVRTFVVRRGIEYGTRIEPYPQVVVRQTLVSPP